MLCVKVYASSSVSRTSADFSCYWSERLSCSFSAGPGGAYHTEWWKLIKELQFLVCFISLCYLISSSYQQLHHFKPLRRAFWRGVLLWTSPQALKFPSGTIWDQRRSYGRRAIGFSLSDVFSVTSFEDMICRLRQLTAWVPHKCGCKTGLNVMLLSCMKTGCYGDYTHCNTHTHTRSLLCLCRRCPVRHEEDGFNR